MVLPPRLGQPILPRRERVEETSANSGMLLKRWVPGASSVANRMGSAACFAPDAAMFPFSTCPPSIIIFSKFTPSETARADRGIIDLTQAV